MPTITKLYSMAEISQHNTADDCWVLIDGRVYDVTRYLDEHPGGDDVLLEVTGKDSKDEFEDAGHSQEARELMKDYCIGELDPSTLTELSKSNKKGKHKAQSSLPSFLNDYRNLLPVVVPVVIAGIVIAGIFFIKRKK